MYVAGVASEHGVDLAPACLPCVALRADTHPAKVLKFHGCHVIGRLRSQFFCPHSLGLPSRNVHVSPKFSLTLDPVGFLRHQATWSCLME